METAQARSLIGALSVIALLAIPPAPMAATEKTLVGMEARARVQQTRFHVTPGAQAFKLSVQNGETRGKGRVSSATVSINGIAVLRPRDFNQNVASIEKEIDTRLIDDGNNVLEIEFNGRPGAVLKAKIVGTYPQPSVMVSWYQDMDFDGYGAGAPLFKLPEGTLPPSPPPVFQWVTEEGDCADRDSDRYPGNGCPYVL
jgi:hypothetical protein